MNVSVALCTYNGEKFLLPQLRSIAEQTRPPSEVVARDDGSSDRTVEILREFAEQAPFPVRLSVNRENLGSTRNFEQAIADCRGEVIALCDQDDVWAPQKLEILEQSFMANPRTEAVFSDAEMVDEHLDPLGYQLWQAVGFSMSERDMFNRGEGFSVLLKHNVVTGATMAFRSRLREVVHPIPGNWIQDGWIALITSAIGPITPIPQALVRYRQHTGQQVSAYRKSFAKRLETARCMTASDFQKDAFRFSAALDRISSLDRKNIHPFIQASIEAKISHMNIRAKMPGVRLFRIPLIMKELLAGNYFRYSEHGWISVFQDLIRINTGNMPSH